MSKPAGEKRSFSNGRVRIERLVTLKHGKKYSSKQWFYRTNINRTTHRFPLGGNLEKALRTATAIKAAVQSGQITVDALLTQYRPDTKLKPKAVPATPPTTILTIEDILNAHAANEKVLALQPRSAQGYRRSLLRVPKMSPASKYDPNNELFVRREDFDRIFAKAVPKATFHRWVAEGKIKKARNLDG